MAFSFFVIHNKNYWNTGMLEYWEIKHSVTVLLIVPFLKCYIY